MCHNVLHLENQNVLGGLMESTIYSNIQKSKNMEVPTCSEILIAGDCKYFLESSHLHFVLFSTGDIKTRQEISRKFQVNKAGLGPCFGLNYTGFIF